MTGGIGIDASTASELVKGYGKNGLEREYTEFVSNIRTR
jgi:hypothetical protein